MSDLGQAFHLFDSCFLRKIGYNYLHVNSTIACIYSSPISHSATFQQYNLLAIPGSQGEVVVFEINDGLSEESDTPYRRICRLVKLGSCHEMADHGIRVYSWARVAQMIVLISVASNCELFIHEVIRAPANSSFPLLFRSSLVSLMHRENIISSMTVLSVDSKTLDLLIIGSKTNISARLHFDCTNPNYSRITQQEFETPIGTKHAKAMYASAIGPSYHLYFDTSNQHTDNAITRISGSIVDGQFSTINQLSNPRHALSKINAEKCIHHATTATTTAANASTITSTLSYQAIVYSAYQLTSSPTSTESILAGIKSLESSNDNVAAGFKHAKPGTPLTEILSVAKPTNIHLPSSSLRPNLIQVVSSLETIDGNDIEGEQTTTLGDSNAMSTLFNINRENSIDMNPLADFLTTSANSHNHKAQALNSRKSESKSPEVAKVSIHLDFNDGMRLLCDHYFTDVRLSRPDMIAVSNPKETVAETDTVERRLIAIGSSQSNLIALLTLTLLRPASNESSATTQPVQLIPCKEFELPVGVTCKGVTFSADAGQIMVLGAKSALAAKVSLASSSIYGLFDTILVVYDAPSQPDRITLRMNQNDANDSQIGSEDFAAHPVKSTSDNLCISSRQMKESTEVETSPDSAFKELRSLILHMHSDMEEKFMKVDMMLSLQSKAVKDLSKKVTRIEEILQSNHQK